MRARRWLACVLVTAVAVAAPTGCGLPRETAVEVEGRGGGQAPTLGDQGTSEPSPRSATTDPEQYLENFLMAAAGDPAKASERVREWIEPAAERRWKPPPEVAVVRLLDQPYILPGQGGSDVAFRVQQVGTLTENGIVEPSQQPPQTMTITLVEVENEGLFVTLPPDRIMLSERALELYYEQRTIYFWAADGSGLVPELRYLPRRDVPAASRPNLIIDWLLRGPSARLQAAVDALPAGAGRVGNVPATSGGMLEVELTKAVTDPNDGELFERLATQLRWSLRSTPSADRSLRLRIDTITKLYEGDDYLPHNPAYRVGRDEIRFCVFKEQVRQLAPTAGALPVPPVPDGNNRQVRSAAMAREGERSYTAVVRAVPGGRVVLESGAGTPTAMGPLSRAGITGQAMSRPVWLRATGGTGLVVVDGVLHSFTAAGAGTPLVDGAPRGITAMSVPPDGRRLAYVVNRQQLFVAPLLIEGGGVRLGKGRQVVPTSLTEVAGVGWSQQEWLAIAGRQADGRVGLYDITVDGAIQEPRSGRSSNAAVAHIVALTDDPSDGLPAPGQVMYVANGLAYELYQQDPQRLTAAEVVGAPSPSPQQGATPANPTAPFFVD
ncbi:MAG TPA: LpqB family beta-propeller domain-containing protein [Pilimelia sp.]|nr:LpqB family beta-propeller domain-containing protein [Pilimelia sp.]